MENEEKNHHDMLNNNSNMKHEFYFEDVINTDPTESRVLFQYIMNQRHLQKVVFRFCKFTPQCFIHMTASNKPQLLTYWQTHDFTLESMPNRNLSQVEYHYLLESKT